MHVLVKAAALVLISVPALAGCAANAEDTSAEASVAQADKTVITAPGQSQINPGLAMGAGNVCAPQGSSAPGYTAPDFQAPTYPAPTFAPPIYTPPQYNAPSYGSPTYQAPSTLPGYTAPTYTAPSYPAPTFEGPVYQAPSYPAPTFMAPVFQAPTFAAPNALIAANPMPQCVPVMVSPCTPVGGTYAPGTQSPGQGHL
jgi:hypothetical protein